MALWQYTFHVLPTEYVQISFINLKDNDEGFDDAPFWLEQQVSPDFFKRISNILPQKRSWSKKIILYGEQESNNFEILFENSIVLSVSFRIDYTSNYEMILTELIELFIMKGLVFLDEELNLMPMNFIAVKSVIENSPQFKKYKQLANNEAKE